MMLVGSLMTLLAGWMTADAALGWWQTRARRATPVPARIEWYGIDAGHPVPLPPDSVPPIDSLTPADLASRRVRWPLQIGIRNVANSKLRDVTVRLRFSDSVSVMGNRVQELVGADGSHVYSIPVGTLEQSNDLTRVAERETLEIQIGALLKGAIRTGDGFPEYIEWFGSPAESAKRSFRIPFTAEVYAEGYRPHEVDLGQWGRMETNHWWPPRQVPIHTSIPSASHRAMWRRSFHEGWDASEHGTTIAFKTETRVEWPPQLFGGGRLVAYRVNGVERRVDADLDSDGNLDAILVGDAGGRLVKVLAPVGEMPLRAPFDYPRSPQLDWKLKFMQFPRPPWSK